MNIEEKNKQNYNILQHRDCRIHNWEGSEFTANLPATEFLWNQASGDSQSTLQALNALGEGAGNIGNGIRINVSRAKERGYLIYIVWIPSHVGIPKHGHTGRIARSAWNRQSMNRDLLAVFADWWNVQNIWMDEEINE